MRASCPARAPSAPSAAPRPFSLAVPQRMPRALPRAATPHHVLPRISTGPAIPHTVRRLYASAEGGHGHGAGSAPHQQPHSAAGHGHAHAKPAAEQQGAGKAAADKTEAPASAALQEEVGKLRSELSKVKETLTAREADLEAMKTNLMYALAEKENIKRLTKTEADNARTFGIQKFANDLLEVADTLKLALKSVSAAEVEQARQPMKEMYKGVELTWKALQKAFGSHGLKEVDPRGQRFDPQVAQAVFQVPPADGKAPGTVAEVIKSAYLLNDRLIRAAMVGVVQGQYQPPAGANANAANADKK